MSPKKQQSAMEYLMTYGWSILIIAIVLAALFSLGVFSNSNLGPRAQPNSCRVYRPNGPGTITNANLEGVCNGEVPLYVADFGGNSYVNVNPSSYMDYQNSASGFTVSVWFYWSSTIGNTLNRQYLWDNRGSSTDAFYLLFIDNPGAASPGITAEGITSTGGQTDATAPLPSMNAWHNVIAVFSKTSNTISVFLDGSRSSVAWTYNTVGTSSGSKELGTPYTHGSYFFNGLISNVQIYDTPLDSASANALYLEGIGGAPVEPQYVVAWWPLDGDTNDYSGNNNNGAATNVAFTSSWTNGYTTP